MNPAMLSLVGVAILTYIQEKFHRDTCHFAIVLGMISL